MTDYITSECIIEEYLNNWFTYQELAEYLCISVEQVEKTLNAACKVDIKIREKIEKHANKIKKYYEELNKNNYISVEDQIYVDIANYMITNQASLRQTAKEFGLGKTTIYDYVHQKLPKVSIVLYKEVFDVLTSNKSYSTNNKQVIEQVLKSYNLLLEGKTSIEIANIQNVGRNVVQRNLTGRLKNIDPKKHLIANEILINNRDTEIKDHRFKANGK